MRLPVNRSLPLLALVFLSACGGGGDRLESAGSLPVNGPAADYPIVLGEPFTVDGVVYTPKDTLNYDAVGYAAVGPDGGTSVTAAHRTLPLPSYVEVTALDTGRTVLVRLERRGPMNGSQLLELSPGAAAQLGIAGNAPIRLRRVNPPEGDRALLRSGQAAPARMDTPKSLLEVLKRKLNQQPGVISGPTRPLPPVAPEPQTPPPVVVKEKPKPVVATPPKPKAPAIRPGALIVQVGAFSSQQRAEAVAQATGASLSQAGTVWRVRMGPFRSEAEAEAALAKARAAGYSEARIQHAR